MTTHKLGCITDKRRDMITEQLLLAEIKSQIDALSEDDRIKVRCIVSTLRNVLAAGGNHARMAIALIGAEMAAEA